MNNEQIVTLHEMKRIELMDLVRSADDERVRLLIKIIEADPRSLEAALSASQEERDT